MLPLTSIHSCTDKHACVHICKQTHIYTHNSNFSNKWSFILRCTCPYLACALMKLALSISTHGCTSKHYTYTHTYTHKVPLFSVSVLAFCRLIFFCKSFQYDFGSVFASFLFLLLLFLIGVCLLSRSLYGENAALKVYKETL